MQTIIKIGLGLFMALSVATSQAALIHTFTIEDDYSDDELIGELKLNDGTMPGSVFRLDIEYFQFTAGGLLGWDWDDWNEDLSIDDFNATLDSDWNLTLGALQLFSEPIEDEVFLELTIVGGAGTAHCEDDEEYDCYDPYEEYYDDESWTDVTVSIEARHEAVPEPAPIALFTLALVGLGWSRWKRRQ